MSLNVLRSLCRALAGFSHDKSGASAMIVAIALPGLIGFAALGVETGVWFTIKLRNQSATDAAAISAAYEIIAGQTNIAELTPAASEAASQNGYAGTTPAITYPYTDNLVSNGVAVTLHQTQGTLLAAMFLSNVTISTKAVAVIEVLDNPCILALATSSTGVEVDGSVNLDVPNCSVVANSISKNAVDLYGNTSSITAATLVTAGEVSLAGNSIDPAAPPSEFILTSPPMIGAPSIPDPYAGTLTHTFLTTGMPNRGCKQTTTTCVIQGLTIKSNRAVDLAPGTYWISGSLTLLSGAALTCSKCNNATGSGVTIVLTAQNGKVGAVTLASNATINLNAPHSGRFAGLVIVQDSNGLPPGTTYTSTHSTIVGGTGTTLNGLVYFPNSSLTFAGHPSTVGPKCLLLVVSSVAVDQSSSLETKGCASAGLVNLPMVRTVALAE
jgi:Flp pilus assembly protein TadG